MTGALLKSLGCAQRQGRQWRLWATRWAKFARHATTLVHSQAGFTSRPFTPNLSGTGEVTEALFAGSAMNAGKRTVGCVSPFATKAACRSNAGWHSLGCGPTDEVDAVRLLGEDWASSQGDGHRGGARHQSRAAGGCPRDNCILALAGLDAECRAGPLRALAPSALARGKDDLLGGEGRLHCADSDSEDEWCGPYARAVVFASLGGWVQTGYRSPTARNCRCFPPPTQGPIPCRQHSMCGLSTAVPVAAAPAVLAAAATALHYTARPPVPHSPTVIADSQITNQRGGRQGC